MRLNSVLVRVERVGHVHDRTSFAARACGKRGKTQTQNKMFISDATAEHVNRHVFSSTPFP